jgi:hypothetical protein
VLRVLKRADVPEQRAQIEKAEEWLRHNRTGNIVTAATLLLAFANDAHSKWTRRENCLDLIRRAQSSDGGWGPYPDSPPEAFDTALVLLALAENSVTVALNK